MSDDWADGALARIDALTKRLASLTAETDAVRQELQAHFDRLCGESTEAFSEPPVEVQPEQVN